MIHWGLFGIEEGDEHMERHSFVVVSAVVLLVICNQNKAMDYCWETLLRVSSLGYVWKERNILEREVEPETPLSL